MVRLARCSWGERGLGSAGVATVPKANPRRFVGRRQELAAVDAALDALRSPRPRWLVVSGEPGIGKTRLLAELAERADARGRIRCSSAAAPSSSASCRSASGSTRSTTTSASLGERRLEQLIGERVGGARARAAVGRAPPARGGLQDERFHAYRAVRALLQQLAMGAPGGADPRRRALGRRRVARADRPPAAAAAAGRRADRARVPRRTGAEQPAGGARAGRRATASSTEVELGPLTQAEADALLGAPAQAAAVPPERRQPVLPRGAGALAGRRTAPGARRGRRSWACRRRWPPRSAQEIGGLSERARAAGLGRGRRGRAVRSRPRRRRRPT